MNIPSHIRGRREREREKKKNANQRTAVIVVPIVSNIGRSSYQFVRPFHFGQIINQLARIHGFAGKIFEKFQFWDGLKFNMQKNVEIFSTGKWRSTQNIESSEFV